MLVPPEKNSASITLMRRPSRTSLVVISIGTGIFGSRNMSTVNRAGTKSSEPWRSSISKASRPTTTRPCSEFGSHGPFAIGLGMKVSRVFGEEGLILSWREEHDGICAMKSRLCAA